MTMKVTLKTVLNNRRAKRDGTFPIVTRIYKDGSSTEIQTGYFVTESEWDSQKDEIVSTCKRYSSINRINLHLSRLKLEIYDKVLVFSEQKTDVLDLKDLRAYLLGKETRKKTLFEYFDITIERMVIQKRIGNSKYYKDVKSSLVRFRNGKDIALHKVDYNFLLSYENFCKAQEHSINTIGARMRALRAVLNFAIKAKELSKESYPFVHYTIKVAETKKRAVSLDVLKSIKNASFEVGTKAHMAQHYFLISFYLLGINYADLARLKLSDLREGRIEYVRRKTHKRFSIKINEPLEELLQPYIKGKDLDDYIFPIIHITGDPEYEYTQITNGLRLFNKGLKDVSKVLRLDVNLTTYVSRHSWATLAKRNGVSYSVISEGLGHKSESITQVYLDSFEKEVVDDCNEAMANLI